MFTSFTQSEEFANSLDGITVTPDLPGLFGEGIRLDESKDKVNRSVICIDLHIKLVFGGEN